jgi:hypothetical protein
VWCARQPRALFLMGYPRPDLDIHVVPMALGSVVAWPWMAAAWTARYLRHEWRRVASAFHRSGPRKRHLWRDAFAGSAAVKIIAGRANGLLFSTIWSHRSWTTQRAALSSGSVL